MANGVKKAELLISASVVCFVLFGAQVGILGFK